METDITIRNCLPTFKFRCPKHWDELEFTARTDVRHCSTCDREVHHCTTDEETIAHAKAGNCIAREIPNSKELDLVIVGMPEKPTVQTPEQKEARTWVGHERAIDDSIKNADSKRSCPQCHYPAPPWRVTCRVCGFEMGRVP